VPKHVRYDLRHLLYHHVQRVSLSFYEHRQTGDMVVRLTSDIDATEDFISSAGRHRCDRHPLARLTLGPVSFYCLRWRTAKTSAALVTHRSRGKIHRELAGATGCS
jgi:ATP-binding cassette, subfamily B, putative efflux pump